MELFTAIPHKPEHSTISGIALFTSLGAIPAFLSNQFKTLDRMLCQHHGQASGTWI